MHRFFYNGGRYVHLSATCKGFRGYIYLILDLVDPKNPVEAGPLVDARPVDSPASGCQEKPSATDDDSAAPAGQAP